MTAAPLASAPTPVLVVSCTDKSVPSVMATLPEPIAVQLGSSSLLGPKTVAKIPVLTGSANPQGLVKMVAVTVAPADRVLSRMFSTRPTMVALIGSTTVLLVNCDSEEEVPRPIHPRSLTD